MGTLASVLTATTLTPIYAQNAAPAEEAPAAATAPAQPATAAAEPAAAPAQPAAPAAPAPPAAAKTSDGGSYRQLAPGVLKTVDPTIGGGETFSQHDVVELLAVDPKFEFAKDVTFRRDIWWLDFQYKPVRVMWIDVPQPNGKMQRKLIWYMVYTVSHPGVVLHPAQAADGTWGIQESKAPIQFIPRFQIVVPELNKAYTDRVIPCALPQIAAREDRNRPLLNSVEMTRTIVPSDQPGKEVTHWVKTGVAAATCSLPEGHGVTSGSFDLFWNGGARYGIWGSVAGNTLTLQGGAGDDLPATGTEKIACKEPETLWGVATWESVDPLVDQFDVYVKGLTNAYNWTDAPGGYKQGDAIGTGRQLRQKTLVLHFWRPGDEENPSEDDRELSKEFRTGQPGKTTDYEWMDLDYEWVRQ